jgi:hypothetical protein
VRRNHWIASSAGGRGGEVEEGEVGSGWLVAVVVRVVVCGADDGVVETSDDASGCDCSGEVGEDAGTGGEPSSLRVKRA